MVEGNRKSAPSGFINWRGNCVRNRYKLDRSSGSTSSLVESIFDIISLALLPKPEGLSYSKIVLSHQRKLFQEIIFLIGLDFAACLEFPPREKPLCF